MRIVIKLSKALSLCLSLLFLYTDIFSQCSLDSIKTMYAEGAQQYSAEKLHTTLSSISANTKKCIGNEYELNYYKGLCLSRLQLIASAQENSKEIKKYGLAAEKAFQSAEKQKGMTFELAVSYTLVYQRMAGLGFTFGMKYGPKMGALVSKIKKERPEHYFTRLIEAINRIDSPTFVGGNPQKGFDALIKLKKEYPDSIDIDIQAARALLKMKRVREAEQYITPVIEKARYNLLARKVKRDILQKKK